MSCNTCGSTSSITAASAPLIQNFSGSKFAPALTGLLSALDQVEVRMRMEARKASWKPSNFPSRIAPLGARPNGTSVVYKNTPLFFMENSKYVYPLNAGGVEGGLCQGQSLCSEPPANQVPGDTFQTFSWGMEGTAWETPKFCLKDLLHYENGISYLENFLNAVEKVPVDFYDNYIRNLIWETGEKYLLAATDYGLLWNSPERVTKRLPPNLNDFRTLSPGGATADAAALSLAAIGLLEVRAKRMFDSSASSLQVEGDRDYMMIGAREDVFSAVYHDPAGPCCQISGGMGFNVFSLGIVDKVPFALKFEDKWVRGDFNPASGEFERIPSHTYVAQNGGEDLVCNPLYDAARYGVLSLMTARPFEYIRFANLPKMPKQVDQRSLQHLLPRFEFIPLLEKCNYSRGIVQWRAEDEFGFRPTGEKIVHIIYRRDELSSFLRAAASGTCVVSPTDCRVDIPTTCGGQELGKCCATTAAAPYRDTAYTLEVNPQLIADLGWNPGALPIAAQLETMKGIFDIEILAINTAGTLITFGVDPAQHIGDQFCCEDQMIGFVTAPVTLNCQAELIHGLKPDPFVLTQFQGILSAELNAVATDIVAVFIDNGCKQVDIVDATVVSIDNNSRRIVLSFAPGIFTDAVPCDAAVKVCAYNTVGCGSCIPAAPVACTETPGLEPLP